ncbi:sulfotransferase, partial [Flavobacteriales bacterium]|nr:sulfotransferase [Flavobacteriales bacterium]
MNQSSDSIFILGPGRSGTSLLQSMLDSNSQVEFIKENQYLRKVLYGKSNISWFLENRKDRLNNLDFLHDNKTLNKLDFYINMINKESKAEIKYIGDKDPNLLDHIEKLISDFQKPKIIFMIRDPRDIILSRIKAKWSSKWPFFLQILIVYSQLNKYNKFISKNNDYSSFINTVKYEDLILFPGKTIHKICSFLNIKYEKEMLDYKKSSERLVSKNEMEWKTKTLQNLDKNNFDKWKNEFS